MGEERTCSTNDYMVGSSNHQVALVILNEKVRRRAFMTRFDIFCDRCGGQTNKAIEAPKHRNWPFYNCRTAARCRHHKIRVAGGGGGENYHEKRRRYRSSSSFCRLRQCCVAVYCPSTPWRQKEEEEENHNLRLSISREV